MGGAASISNVFFKQNKEEEFHSDKFSKEDFSNYFASLGKGYETYKNSFIENGVDMNFISGIKENDILPLLEKFGISSDIHQKKIKEEILKIKKNLLDIATRKFYGAMHGKFDTVSKYFVCGDHKDYVNGLTEKIKSLYRSMEDECMTNDDGKWKVEYDYVVYQKAEEKVMDPDLVNLALDLDDNDVVNQKAQEKRIISKNPKRIRDLGHAGMELSDFLNDDRAVKAKLTQAEVASLRLYTGVFYEPWNNALRFYNEDPTLLENWATCICVLYSAVLKLSSISKSAKVYRGVNESECKLPDEFFKKKNKDGFSGGVELAFMSTSTDFSIASEYSKRGARSECSIFEIIFTAASRAADIQWVSQYPYEQELLYPPCTYVECEKWKWKRDIDGFRVKRITAKLTVSNAHYDLQAVGIQTVTDYDIKATPRRPSNVNEQKKIELKAFLDNEVDVKFLLEKGYTISEITSIENCYSLINFIEAGCSWNDLYGSGCFTKEKLKAAIPCFIKNECTSWEDLLSFKYFTIKDLKDAGCPGYILRQLGVSNRKLKDIGYEKCDIYTVREMVHDLKKTPIECYKNGYTCAQIRKEGFELESKWLCIQTLKGHTEGVNSITAFPDGKSVASGSLDKLIKIWDFTTGVCIQTLEGHTESVSSVIAFSDGKYLASGSLDRSIKIWDVATGICINSLKGHTDSVNSIIVLPDGKSLASGSSDNTIKVWDLETGAFIQTLKGHTKGVNSVIVLPDNKCLASGSSDNSIKIWDLKSGACIQTLEGKSRDCDIWTVTALLDGKSIASGSSDTPVKIWNAKSGKCTQTFKQGPNKDSFWSVIALPDGKSLVTGSKEHIIKIWNLESRSCIKTLLGHASSVTSIINLDAKFIASGSYDASIKIWEESPV